MLKQIKKYIRRFFAVFLLFSMSVLILIATWSIQLNEKISEGLKNKKFLPPTQYFSAPEYIFNQMNISASSFKDKLTKRGYAAKETPEKLKFGEYFFSENYDQCLKIAEVPANTKSCFLFKGKESEDPEFQIIRNQLITFDKEVTGTFANIASTEVSAVTNSGTASLAPVEAIQLEPRIVAQYLDKEPIQQKYVPLGEIPVTCLNAVLAIEDAKFLEHSGISYSGLARAAIKNLLGSRFTQGGSTITQQLVKNYFLTSERTLKRKATEFLMSLILEAHSSKDEILETYLNVIYLGQNGPFQVRGFPAASEYYFNKNIQNLDLHECALLAATLNSPGLYDPFKKPENASKRRNLVLDKMLEHQFIGNSELETAKNQVLPTRSTVNVSETAPYYIDAVQKELTRLSIPTSGKKIFMGLDLEAQQTAQNSVREQLNKLEAENKSIKAIREGGKLLESVLISANNKTGLIQAIVGGRSYKLTQFNRAIEGHRQAGSIMKPFVFLAALESSTPDHVLNPTTTLHDSRFSYQYQNQNWSPENYGKKYFGDIPMFFALKNSLNCATASLGIQIGLNKIAQLAHLAGIDSKLEEVPSLTLGSFELFPKEVLQSYSTLSNLGLRKNLRTIRSVVDDTNHIIFQTINIQEQTISNATTSSLVSMMKQTILGGTAKLATHQGFTYHAAGKTGTTSDNRDSWFAGFTPNITTIVWVGYDDNTSHGLTGATGALPIWINYMKTVGTLYPDEDFNWPENVTKIRIDNPNLLVPNDTPQFPELVFVKGQEPR